MAEEKKFVRSTSDKMIAGVCGGLAQYFGIDATIVRALFVFFSLWVGGGVLVYIVLWVIMPEEGGTSIVEDVTSSSSSDAGDAE